MVRVKRGKTAHKRRKRVLKHTKGFKWGRKTKYRLAKQALMHAWTYSYRDRKAKKRTFRQLQQTKINAAARAQGIPYSKLINMLKRKKIVLDRKILADLAENNPEIFEKIIKQTVQEK